MKPYYADESVTVHHGDCLDVLRTLPDASVDSVVTDPPYGLGFMGKAWDDLPPGEEWARECLRVLKPGGHLLAFGGTRTWHRLACAVEDAGFEVRDSIAWLYGSGFPKSLDVSKAIDKAAGAAREVVGDKLDRPGYHLHAHDSGTGALGRGLSSTTAETRLAAAQITAPATPDAERWQGWGTALKPAFEPVVVARKPLVGTVAGNVLAHGTGALNIDGCRIGMSEADRVRINNMGGFGSAGWTTENGTAYEGRVDGSLASLGAKAHTAGRWPANVVLDETQADALDQQSGTTTSTGGKIRSASREATQGASNGGAQGGYNLKGGAERLIRGDTGGASRFFYVAKAPKRERPRTDDGTAHPTVKPLALMRWLVRLVTPPGGVVLEPFAGSGTTVEACIVEGFRCIAIEREADYLPLIEARIARQLEAQEQAEPDLFSLGEESA